MKFMFLKKCLIYFLIFSPYHIFSQVSFDIKGQVLDATTGEALAFANIFVANTTIGVNSNDRGEFLLQKIPKGEQEIIFSFLGYETFVKKINVNEYSTKRIIEVKLKLSAVQLSEVEVKAVSSKKRRKYLKRFNEAFLGKTENADKCKILNPEIIEFQKDGKKVIAKAKDLIEVENKALGFKLKFYLEKFEMEGKQVVFGGKPMFQELESKNQGEKAKWNAARQKTYAGSPTHFYKALVSNNLNKEGFKIFFAQQKNVSEFHNIRPTKAKRILKESNNSTYQYLKIDDFLKVIYTKEKSERRRILGNSLTKLGQTAEKDLIEQTKNEVGNTSNYPTSYLFARKSAMKISNNGRLIEPELMLVYGDWANEGVADMLPVDFQMDIPKELNTELQGFPKKKGFTLSNLLIPLDEIKDGGPPKNGIPSIDRPKFISGNKVDFLDEREYVLGVNFNGIAKAYPIKIMDRHEVVNDFFDDIPVAITFCPLCASGVGVKAKVENVKHTFGVSGLLYNSDVLLYDRETESLWSQILGRAISGESSGKELDLIPTEFTTWGNWKKRFTNSLVLTTNTGFSIDYEKEAYQRYFQNQKLLFPVTAENNILKNKDKIIGIEVDGKFKAYPFKKLRKIESPLKDEFKGKTISIFFDKENQIARIEDENGDVLSAQTMFWFAWFAFHQETEIF